ncbi:MAG TPA: AI-2E family transporter [Acidimicrobiales bacterium]|nr:AI-2E family transporter [Acidimicrobiales bacterium]
MSDERRPVPVRTILATIGLVLATVVGLYLIVKLAHIEALLIVAAFFAVVFTPPVNWVRRHLHLSRGLATTVVFLVGLAVMAGLLYTFIRPIVDQGRQFSNNFPTYLTDAREGRGPLGGLVKKYNLDQRYEDNKQKITDWAKNAGGGAVSVAGRFFQGIVSLVTVLVLAVLMVLYGPELLEGGLGILGPPKRERVKAVAADCARAITGYVLGNLLISVIAGALTYVALLAFGVPFRGVLALWVGFADLIPLVGATLGAIPTIGVAFLHSTGAGIGIVIFYVVYQQFENHVLQVQIMSKTVDINQLFVLVSVLVGVELFGILGALLAIPAAGVMQVIVRDLWDHRAGRFKEEPTIGEDQTPLSEVIDEEDEAPPAEPAEPAEPADDTPDAPADEPVTVPE